MRTRSTGDRVSAWLMVATTIWIASAALYNLFSFELDEFFGILMFLATLGWVGFGGMLVAAGVVLAFVERFRPWNLLAVGCIFATVWGLVEHGSELAIQFQFLRNRTMWERMAAGERGDASMIVDAFSGHRLHAFPVGASLTDNWCAFVRDEAEVLAPANGLDFYDPAFEPYKAIFGGDLMGCDTIEKPWLFCCWT